MRIKRYNKEYFYKTALDKLLDGTCYLSTSYVPKLVKYRIDSCTSATRMLLEFPALIIIIWYST